MMTVYRLFGGDHDSYDYSEEAAVAYFLFESTGKGYIGFDRQPNGKYNGYAVGKHGMDVTISTWIEEIMKCQLFLWELYEDPQFSEFHWWLDKVVKEPIRRRLDSGQRLDLWFLKK